MRVSRVFTSIVSAAIVLSAAACGAPGSNQSGASTPTPGGSSTPTPTSTPSGTPTPGGSCSPTCNAPFTCDTASNLCKNQGVPQFSHVWVVVMENTNYSSITPSAAPYFTGTLYPKGVQMQNYWAVTHPSLPNYIAMVGGDTFGISSDGPASSSTYQVSSSTPNIASQLEAAGLTWHEYSESQTTACALSDSGSDSTNTHFVSKHDPMPHYLITQSSASCAADDVSFEANGNMPGMAADLAAGRAYNYSFIAPNLCDDGHDLCTQVASTKVGEQDKWLSNNVGAILASPAYQQNGLLIVTWDENDNTSGSGASQIATLYLSPLLQTPGSTNSTHYSHYSMLATVEAGLGLANLPAANGHGDALITDIWK